MDRSDTARFGLEDSAANRSPKNKTVIEPWMGGEHGEDQVRTVSGMRGIVL